MYFGVLFKLFKVLEFMVLKREMMSKSVKWGWQKTWAPGGWRLSGCFWVVWLAKMVSMLFSKSKEFLLGEF